MKATIVAGLVVVGLLASVMSAAEDAQSQPRRLEQRWLYVRTSFLADDASVESFVQLMRRGQAAGVTHISLSEGGMSRWDLVDDAYLARVKRAQDAAKEFGIALIPQIFPVGYGGRFMVHEPMLAAGIPAVDVPFVIRSGAATPDAATAPAIANTGFDEADGDELADWRQDHAGVSSFVDRDEKRSGSSSVKFANFNADRSSVRVTQMLDVKPFQYYSLVLWAKTDGIEAEGEDYVQIFAGDNSRRLTYMNTRIRGTQDWTRHEIFFNTFHGGRISFSRGVGAATAGTIWFDDITVEPAGIMNVVRRELTPFKVASADGATAYEEGRDYVLTLPANGPRGGGSLSIPSGSRIHEGETVSVSYYHTLRIYNDQTVLSIEDPMMFELMEKQMEHVAKIWPSEGYFMISDEVRVAGWEIQPDGENLSPAELLARYTQRGNDLVRKYDPDADIYIWSDMYTPYHNARPFSARNAYYYLVNGNSTGRGKAHPAT